MDTTKLILKDDFDGNLNNDIWTYRNINLESFCFVDDPVNENKKCLQITVEKGDRQEVGRDGKFTERAELRERSEILIPLNNSVWYRFGFLIPADFAIVDNRFSFAQWKQYYKEEKQSPFLSFHYRNGQLVVKLLGKNLEEKYRNGDELRGAWHDVVVNYELDNNLSGKVKIWLDNNQLVNYVGNFGFDYTQPIVYFKMGAYRDTLDVPQRIYFKYFRRGPTKNDIRL